MSHTGMVLLLVLLLPLLLVLLFCVIGVDVGVAAAAADVVFAASATAAVVLHLCKFGTGVLALTAAAVDCPVRSFSKDLVRCCGRKSVRVTASDPVHSALSPYSTRHLLRKRARLFFFQKNINFGSRCIEVSVERVHDWPKTNNLGSRYIEVSVECARDFIKKLIRTRGLVVVKVV